MTDRLAVKDGVLNALFEFHQAKEMDDRWWQVFCAVAPAVWEQHVRNAERRAEDKPTVEVAMVVEHACLFADATIAEAKKRGKV